MDGISEIKLKLTLLRKTEPVNQRDPRPDSVSQVAALQALSLVGALVKYFVALGSVAWLAKMVSSRQVTELDHPGLPPSTWRTKPSLPVYDPDVTMCEV
jgi:hypothetical protein